MKKIITVAAIIGLIAVPGMAFASTGADDNTPTATTNVKQEDHQANQPGEDRQANQPAEVNDDAVTPTLPATASSNAVAATSGAVIPSDNDNDNDDSVTVAEDNSGANNQESSANSQGDNSGSGHRGDNSGSGNRDSNHVED